MFDKVHYADPIENSLTIDDAIAKKQSEDGEEADTIEVIIEGDEAEGIMKEVLTLAEELIKEEEEFYSNLAETLDETVLLAISDEVVELYDADENSRSEWKKMYREGVELLGLGMEERTEPWAGASGVFHPLMAEAAVRFQAEAISETFSAQGVCKTSIVGKITEEKEEAARRVQDDINWRLTTQMKEYRPEHERMLWNLAIAGSAFKKIYFDPTLGRQTSAFVAAEDLIVPYGATDISTAPRIAHRMRKSLNDVKKLQAGGFYREVQLDEPGVGQTTEADDVVSKITGIGGASDDRLELIEMFLDLEIEGHEDKDEDGEMTGIKIPYVVTIEKSSGKVLSVYRNWERGDAAKTAVQHFVHYIYIPGFGFYGMGLVHLVGGFAKSATSLMRQLIDAGVLANVPCGLKTKGIRFQRDSDPIAPGEFRDVDVPAGTLKDNIMPLPFKEPSQTLYNLFNTVVEEGRRMAAVSDVNAADMNQQAPVGTTLAILERSMKVMTAIQARLHAALKEELTILKKIIRDNLPPVYDYEVEDDEDSPTVKQEDYDLTEILPVSDPNAATMSQRVVQYQAVLQMAREHPTIYDQVELNRQMLEVLGVKNIEKLVPATEDYKPRDPITENMALLTGKPVKAFSQQDHQSHITVLMSLKSDPKIAQLMGQSPNSSIIMAAIDAHLAEHVAFDYKRQVEEQLGVTLPDSGTDLPPEIEREISNLMAKAAQQALMVNQQKAAQAQAEQSAKDPVVQNQTKELEISAGKLQLEGAKLQAKQQDSQAANSLNLAELKLKAAKIAVDAQSAKDIASMKIAADLSKNLGRTERQI